MKTHGSFDSVRYMRGMRLLRWLYGVLVMVQCIEPYS
jgi:hypothetical protein